MITPTRLIPVMQLNSQDTYRSIVLRGQLQEIANQMEACKRTGDKVRLGMLTHRGLDLNNQLYHERGELVDLNRGYWGVK